MRKLNALSLLLLLPVGGLQAQEFAPAPPPPPLAPEESAQPPVSEQGTAMPEPEVTIIKRKEETIEEYRINGQLYMIKVTPAKGKPYYLIDHEGSGQFRRSDFETRISIPTWVIKRF